MFESFHSPLRRRLTFILAAVLASLLYPANLQSQQDDDVVRVNTDLVILNVTVTDKAGQYVPGLRLPDFTIFEDGKQIPPQLIASFSVHESPFASVVLLDTSGSMETRLSLGRSAAIRFLDRLRDEDVAAVYTFGSKVEQLQDFSSSRDLAPMAFGLHAKGMTTLNDAIVDAAKALAARAEKRKAIIVLSDGVDTFSKSSADKAIENALAIGATIYAVDMSPSGVPPSREKLQSIAILRGFTEKSGGRFVTSPGGQALRDAFAGIADELGHQYTIAYRPLNQTRDGKWRKLDVKISRSEFEVRTRKAYRAPKG